MTRMMLGGISGAGSERHRSREGHGIAVGAHGPDLDGTEAGEIRQGCPGHAGEDDAAEDVDLGQATTHPADESAGESEDAVGEPSGIHQVAGEDEEGHGQQREAVDAVDHAGGNDCGRHPDHPDADHGGNAEGDRHRHAQQEQGERDHHHGRSDHGSLT